MGGGFAVHLVLKNNIRIKPENSVNITNTFILRRKLNEKIVTMGEIMLRLSTPNNEKFIQADEFDINYGGGRSKRCGFLRKLRT